MYMVAPVLRSGTGNRSPRRPARIPAGPGPSRLPWRHLAAAAACAALGLLAFGRDARVPLLGWIDLCVHEFGHVATAFGPPIVTAMAGSAAQVLLPLALAAAFWFTRREPLSAMVCLAWAGTSAHDVAAYIADAPYERLELIGGTHDWAYALGPEGFDALGSAAAIAGAVRGAGFLAVLLATAWCLLSALRERREPEPATSR
jgi:hypothetical protein